MNIIGGDSEIGVRMESVLPGEVFSAFWKDDIHYMMKTTTGIVESYYDAVLLDTGNLVYINPNERVRLCNAALFIDKKNPPVKKTSDGCQEGD